MLKRIGAALAAAGLCASAAQAQTIPYTFATQQGYVPASELDTNFSYIPTWAKGYFCGLSGCALTGKLILNPSAAGAAGLNLGIGAAPTAPVNGDLWMTTSGLYAQYGGATVGPMGAGGGTGTLVGIQYLTSGSAATFTPDAGTNSVLIILVGAGGGGSGVASPGAGSVYLGSGGNSGGILQKRLTSGFSGATFTIGTGGSGGTAGANNGSAGGDTTFTTTGAVTYTAKGGSGGVHNGPFAPGFVSGIPAYNATSGGDLSWSGNAGSMPISVSLNNNMGGSGGWNIYSTGGWAVVLGGTNTGSVGYAADGYGGGGSGAVATGTGAAQSGGNGSGGLIIVWEYR